MKTNEHHPADKHQVTTALELIDHINGFGNLFITMGGVGGIGKTAFAVSTVDALQHNKLEPQIVDADEENSANKAGCLKKFFPGAHKIDIKTRQGLDAMATISLASPWAIWARLRVPQLFGGSVTTERIFARWDSESRWRRW
jgi:hypothetical protein